MFADRLADALGTMHHGFCLFDAAGRVVTGSASLGTLLRIPVPAPGTDADGIATACDANGTRARGGARLAAVLAKLAAATEQTTRDIPLEDGRTLSFTATPKAGGGSVLVLEDVTERVAAEARLVRMARHDSLTGLLNRAAAAETLDGCIGRNEPVAIHLIDLDRFKGVNDSFGHSVGDGLLRAVASRVTAILPEGSHAARLGGDEFLVLQVGHASQAPALAAAISAAIDAPYEVDGRELSISASIGNSVFPRDGEDGGTLMRNADTALYQVKTGGRHGWRAFDPGMDEAARERREMEGDLREAVAARAFEVVYQPQMDLASGGTTTYEALVRWDRPGRGPVSPADFIPLAEETGLIHAIGRIVLEMACREAAGWDEGTRVAVNISPAQFRNDIPGTVAQVLAATGLPARRLELEVTESVFLESQDHVLAAFRHLAGMGVRISLDDFGTGYSSLGYLRAFPFDKVKVDRSFVGDIEAKGESRAIVRAVIGLGADLGMQVVAEGVETPGQLSALRELRCDAVQGYLVSRPLRPEDVPARKRVRTAA
jgi:diguanylate cyclase (GGDEF)-like protein